jgi:hypothetical protein
MKNPKISSKIGFLVVAAAICMFLYTVSTAADGSIISRDGIGKYFADRIIITCKSDTPLLNIGECRSGVAISGIESLDLLCERYGVSRIEQFYPGKIRHESLRKAISRIYIIDFSDFPDLIAAIADFAGDPNVECADLYTIPEPLFNPNDPEIGQQWYLETTRAYQAWDTVRGDTTSHAIIGIVDTGVYWDHPDLAANIWINDAEDVNHNGNFDNADNDGIDADSNGFFDDVVGWDMGESDNNPAESTPTHGTAIAGAASEVTDNGINGAGIGYSARLMAVKGSNRSGQLSMVYQGIVYAADNGVDIINCSWGSPTYSQASQNIINAVYAIRVSVIAATGSTTNIVYPAGYDHVVAVGATDENDLVQGNADEDSLVDVYAPGTSIRTTWGHESMTSLDGTSLSSPIVCGLAALIMSWHPEYTPDQVEETIESSADSIGSFNPSHPDAIRINCENWLHSDGIAEPVVVPQVFTLLQNYPNPFNAQTELRFYLPSESNIDISMYDITGRKVFERNCGRMQAGYQVFLFDSKKLSSGAYFYRINAGTHTATSKCLLLK